MYIFMMVLGFFFANFGIAEQGMEEQFPVPAGMSQTEFEKLKEELESAEKELEAYLNSLPQEEWDKFSKAIAEAELNQLPPMHINNKHASGWRSWFSLSAWKKWFKDLYSY